MELRAYGNLLKRRWLFALVPALVVLALGLATYRPAPAAYNVGVRFIVGQAPSDAARQEDEERLANWQTSEYVVNGLTDWVRGGQFAALVSQELAAQGRQVPAGAIQGGLAADNVRSMMTLSLSYGEPEALQAMMEAAIRVVTRENAQGLPQLGGDPAQLVLLDQPVVNRLPAGIRGQLELPLRLALALVAGIGLAFLVDYLDPTVRDRQELEAAGWHILGEIPHK